MILPQLSSDMALPIRLRLKFRLNFQRNRRRSRTAVQYEQQFLKSEGHKTETSMHIARRFCRHHYPLHHAAIRIYGKPSYLTRFATSDGIF